MKRVVLGPGAHDRQAVGAISEDAIELVRNDGHDSAPAHAFEHAAPIRLVDHRSPPRRPRQVVRPGGEETKTG